MNLDRFTKEWRRAELEVLYTGLVFLLVGGCMGTTMRANAPQWPTVAAYLAGMVILVVALVLWYWRRKGMVTKVFYDKPEPIVQMVWNFLQQKGLSFDQVNRPAILPVNTVFKLPADQMSIRVREFRREHHRGVRVDIGPVTDGNRLIVESLQEELNSLFGPRGIP